MDKANIIISIIIVLCIAAAVAAYGITNSDNPIFSDLSSMGANDDIGSGLGNNSTAGNGSGLSVATTDGSSSSNGGSSDSGSSDSGSGSSYDSGSGDDSGSYSSDSGSNTGSDDSGSDSGSGDDGPSVSASTIQSDAWGHIGEEGSYPGNPYYSGSYWYVTIYDANGSAVDSFQYSSSGEFLGRG